MIEGFNNLGLEEIFIKDFIKDFGNQWFGLSTIDRESFKMVGRVK